MVPARLVTSAVIPGRVAFLDLETTGTDPRGDRVTEVGLLLADDGVVIEEWSALVNPGRGIPPGIERITGISEAMVSQAPGFADLALELVERLQGRLLVAHNARFDYAFLRNELKRAGLNFQSRVLCTVRLSRALFPEHPRHNLDALVERYALPGEGRHRALPDARLLYHLAEVFGRCVDTARLHAAIEALADAPRAPPGVNADLLDDAPDAPGVYLLYDPHGAPLFTGKAANLRAQLLAHFTSRGRHAQEQRQALQAGAVEWFPSAGELGTQLRYLRLVETLAPRHNRRPRQQREAWALRWRPEAAHEPLACVDLDRVDEPLGADLYGPFRSRADALGALRGLAREHGLCATALGLESITPCSGHTAGWCRGLCAGRESRAAHTLRLMHALLRLRMRAWPWRGAVAIVEEDRAHTRCELHLVRAWRYLGSASSVTELQELAQAVPVLPSFDVDVYRLLQRAFEDARHLRVIDLSAVKTTLASPE